MLKESARYRRTESGYGAKFGRPGTRLRSKCTNGKNKSENRNSWDYLGAEAEQLKAGPLVQSALVPADFSSDLSLKVLYPHVGSPPGRLPPLSGKLAHALCSDSEDLPTGYGWVIFLLVLS